MGVVVVGTVVVVGAVVVVTVLVVVMGVVVVVVGTVVVLGVIVAESVVVIGSGVPHQLSGKVCDEVVSSFSETSLAVHDIIVSIIMIVMISKTVFFIGLYLV